MAINLCHLQIELETVKASQPGYFSQETELKTVKQNVCYRIIFFLTMTFEIGNGSQVS